MDEHTLNDLLECSVCLERLDTSSKVLPCQHTFCRKCLEVIYASRQELRCPECRVLVDTKIDDLPPNVLLMRILEGMKHASASKQQKELPEQESSDKNEIQMLSQNTRNSGDNQEQAKERQQLQLQQQHQVLPFQQQQTTLQQAFISTQQQQQQQQQQVPHYHHHHHTHQQQRRCVVPHAYALYDFESNEPSDLSFKKGDLILLRRKIDSNWYVGQLKGNEGTFPINYVQVVVPLPTPQCIALYDFKMGPNEEEGCLTFKKGTLIHVLRRVDQNWAEGRIGSVIGIFPIAFVELNVLAKQLLDSFVPTTQHQHQQPQPPPQPATQQQQQQTVPTEIRNLPPVPLIEPTANVTVSQSATDSTTSSSSSSSSSTTISPSTDSSVATSLTSTAVATGSSSTSFHSMPNSPQASLPNTPQRTTNCESSNSGDVTSSVRMRSSDLKQKRHSLNALPNNSPASLSVLQTNRHSAEILSVPHELSTSTSFAGESCAVAKSQTTAAREQQQCSPQSHQHQHQQQQQQHQHQQQYHSNTSSYQQTHDHHQQQSSMGSASQLPRHNVLKTCVQQNVPPSLPWGYLALYPYKPRKPDELELKKGCVYIVTERCLDGWFKGKNWKDICGVFPGNYVTPLRARDQQQLMHGWKCVPPPNKATSTPQPTNAQSQTATATATATGKQQLSPSYCNSMRTDLENINARLAVTNNTQYQALPPELPPRQATPNQLAPAKETKDKDIAAIKEKSSTTGCISSPSSSATSSASAGLKKLLTHIKVRSKSPNATGPVNQQSQQKQQHQHQLHSKQSTLSDVSITPVHVRSGSCPSQLLQNLPEVKHTAQMNETYINQGQQQTSVNYSSQRIKGNKERIQMPNPRTSIDAALRGMYTTTAAVAVAATVTAQQQTVTTDNLSKHTKCGQQQQEQQPNKQQQYTQQIQNPNLDSNATHHRKSHSLDASNILQTTQSLQSTTTGSTSVLVPVPIAAAPACNVSAAAVHGSGTTKSIQTTLSESRFRCVVPYPPNSDIELELQVGDVIFVYRKQKNGWYKGTNARTFKTGLFPASFVEPDI